MEAFLLQASQTATNSNGTPQLLSIVPSNVPVAQRIEKIRIKNKRLLFPQLLGGSERVENEYYVETNEQFIGKSLGMDIQEVQDVDLELEPELEEDQTITDSDEEETSEGENDNETEDIEMEVDSIIDDSELNQDDSLSHKTFKERATELMRKTQGEHSHLVKRTLTSDDWLFIHRIIRKSKGLKSKFMMRNLSPFLFDEKHVESWKCKFCNEMIGTPAKEYVDHFIAHSNGMDDDPLFPCDVCGDYIKKEKYVVHWVPHFMEHECPICKKTFALNCHMRYHYKVVHEEGEQTCFQCGKLMKNDLAMRRHIRLFHSNRTNWKICDICGKCVKSRCLEPHKLTHSQDRPYKCDICKKCFKTPSTLYQHQKVHATDSKAHKYLCEYCGKRFKHHTSWNLHVVRIHEGEYEHECTVCHKRFHKLFELKKHSVKHSEDRPYPCGVCGKHFKTKTHLKEHVTIHSEEKSHVCPLCGKGIRMKANLYKHLKVHRNRGEYVPPLNGNSTNLLFNNYGFPSSMNSISNGTNNCGSNKSTAISTSTSTTSSSLTSTTVCSSDNRDKDSNEIKSTSSASHLIHTNNDSDNVNVIVNDENTTTTEADISPLLREPTPDLMQTAQLHLPVENQNQVVNSNNLSLNSSQYTQLSEELVAESTSTILLESEEGEIVQMEQDSSPIQYQHQLLVFDPNTSTILNLQGAEQFDEGKNLQSKYECTIVNSEQEDTNLSGQTFDTCNSSNINHGISDSNLGAILNGTTTTATSMINALGIGNLSFHGNSDEIGIGNYSTLSTPSFNFNQISIPSHLISLIAPQADNIRINGSSITHFTIMVNHNGLNGLTLAPVQSE